MLQYNTIYNIAILILCLRLFIRVLTSAVKEKYFQRFLHFMVGSIYDHAVALTCYFLALKIEAWLLLGFGLPYGTTAFVLVKEYDNNPNSTYYIYDVVTSEKMSLIEPFCPLQRIYCLVNENNVSITTLTSFSSTIA